MIFIRIKGRIPLEETPSSQRPTSKRKMSKVSFVTCVQLKTKVFINVLRGTEGDSPADGKTWQCPLFDTRFRVMKDEMLKYHEIFLCSFRNLLSPGSMWYKSICMKTLRGHKVLQTIAQIYESEAWVSTAISRC